MAADEQLTLDVSAAAAPSGPLQPGDWTPTGWGARHRVRSSDEKWTELVCHTTLRNDDPSLGRKAGDSARCQTSRIDRSAVEAAECRRCASLPDLGPLQPAPLGEIRRSPQGLVVVASNSRATAAEPRWKVIGDEPELYLYGWRTDWDVTRWECLGNALEPVSAEGWAR